MFKFHIWAFCYWPLVLDLYIIVLGEYGDKFLKQNSLPNKNGHVVYGNAIYCAKLGYVFPAANGNLQKLPLCMSFLSLYILSEPLSAFIQLLHFFFFGTLCPKFVCKLSAVRYFQL